ncbi:MAG: hypothetical protein SGARI_004955, partial [Bacillariaceae sp.]
LSTESQVEQQPATESKVPTEVWAVIFERMDTVDLLLQISPVCKTWSKAVDIVLIRKKALQYKEQDGAVISTRAEFLRLWRREQELYWRAHALANPPRHIRASASDPLEEYLTRGEHFPASDYWYFVQISRGGSNKWHGMVPLKPCFPPSGSCPAIQDTCRDIPLDDTVLLYFDFSSQVTPNNFLGALATEETISASATSFRRTLATIA